MTAGSLSTFQHQSPATSRVPTPQFRPTAHLMDLARTPQARGPVPQDCPPAEASGMPGVSPGPPLPFLASCEFRSSHGSPRFRCRSF